MPAADVLRPGATPTPSVGPGLRLLHERSTDPSYSPDYQASSPAAATPSISVRSDSGKPQTVQEQSQGSSSSGSFFSQVRKVPQTLKNLSLNFLKSSSGNSSKNSTPAIKPSRKKKKIKPEDLFESDYDYDDDEDPKFKQPRGSTVPKRGTSPNTPKRYATNVDTKQYNIPSRAERKRRYSNNSRKNPPPAVPTPAVTQTTVAPLTLHDDNNDKPAGCLAFIYGHTVHGLDPIFAESYAARALENPLQNTRALRPVGSNDDIASLAESDSEDEEEERINPGYKEWKRRRSEWTRGAKTQEPQESIVKNMSESERVMVYKHLVMNNRRVKKPMMLSDVMDVLHSGWAATGL